MVKKYRIKAEGRIRNGLRPYIKGPPGAATWADKSEATKYSPKRAFKQLEWIKGHDIPFQWELEAVDD